MKYSSEFSLRLGKGRSQVFRWTGICGHGKATKKASVLILVGLDGNRNVWFWVIPYSAVGSTGTVTTVVPNHRTRKGKGNLDGYQYESSDILPMILHYDREYRAALAKEKEELAAQALEEAKSMKSYLMIPLK